MVVEAEGIESRLLGQLEDLRGSYDQAILAPRTARRADTIALLLFEIGSAAFAVPANCLVEVVRAEGIVSVPCAPSHIAGAITHRQEVVSVLDLRRLLKIPDPTNAKPGWILVLRPRSTQCAILADSVIGIRRVNLTRLPQATESRHDTPIIADSVTIDGQPVAIVDTESLASGTFTTGQRGASTT